MNKQIERLQALTRELIKKLVSENRELKTLTRTLSNRIRDLEQQCIVIDREMAEIPIGFDLIPENDLNRF
jgi:hypothetical protein